MNAILSQLLALSGGYKTYVAGVGLIALGVYQLSQADAADGVKSLAQGLGLLGLRHAIATAADAPVTAVEVAK